MYVTVSFTIITVGHEFMSDDNISILQLATENSPCICTMFSVQDSLLIDLSLVKRNKYILKKCSVFPSPDDHVAVGTHRCTSPSRNVFCHLDQGVLIFRVWLRYRSGWDKALRDNGTSIALHTERWTDQTSLWTMAL